MAKRPKIQAVTHSPDTLELLKTVLDESGCQTATMLMGLAEMAETERFAPDAILVELTNGHPDDLALLDQLHRLWWNGCRAVHIQRDINATWR